MPPQLAAFLIFGFILWALRRDLAQSSGLSGVLWLPTLWFLLLASKPLHYWVYSTPSTDLLTDDFDGIPLDRLAFLFLTVAGIVCLARRGLDRAVLVSENRTLIVFYLYLAASVLWSDFPGVALKRYIKEIGSVVMLLLILTERDKYLALRHSILRVSIILVPLSFLYAKYYTEIGRYYNMWTGEAAIRGATTDKNALGRLAMLCYLFILCSLQFVPRGQRWRYCLNRGLHLTLLLPMTLWLLLRAKSSTSLGCAILGTIVIFSISSVRVRSRPRLLTLATVSYFVFCLLFMALPDVRAPIAALFGKDADLTERTDIWARIPDLPFNPLIGAGFFSFWLTDAGTALSRELKVPHAHNGYIEAYLHSGLIGFSLLVLVLSRAARNVLAHTRRASPGYVLLFTVFIVGITYNLTEAALNINAIMGLLLLFTAFSYSLNDSPVASPALHPALDNCSSTSA